MDTLQVIRPVVDYHQQQFARTDRVFSREVPPYHIVKFLRAGVGAHTHVDICIYGVLHRLTPVDLEFMRRLSTMVNIVPVILKCDTLKPEEVFRLKATILEELQKAKISIYTFGMTSEELIDLAQGGYAGAAPFAFSAPEIMGEIGGARPGSYAAEFMQFKTALLYNHIDDFRTLTAEKFVNWRQNANGGSGGGR